MSETTITTPVDPAVEAVAVKPLIQLTNVSADASAEGASCCGGGCCS
ncbi:hypothetical protein [Microterricola viridarii]|uniref:Uncharacterized protein n=1 Tax=Microterricola viridarii TaxID=412690 RepID=A0A1H1VN15_9MICO|nr:hypothetical protein [Microterricola viridarii]SDS86123.1 hypothetical protein SAMN04489834_2310 [Microterricola viridarii]